MLEFAEAALKSGHHNDTSESGDTTKLTIFRGVGQLQGYQQHGIVELYGVVKLLVHLVHHQLLQLCVTEFFGQ